jgi:hypothetical protein
MLSLPLVYIVEPQQSRFEVSRIIHEYLFHNLGSGIRIPRPRLRLYGTFQIRTLGNSFFHTVIFAIDNYEAFITAVFGFS